VGGRFDPDIWRGRWIRAGVVLALMGATLGVSLDVMHVKTGTTAYTNPTFFGIAWWVFPLFGSAGIPFGLARPAWERLLGWRTPPHSLPDALLGVAFFVAAYLASGVLPLAAAGKFAVLSAILIACWIVCDRSLLGILLAVGAAIGGSAFESAIIALDFFHYVHPDFAGISSWLPLLYGTVGIAVGNLGKHLVDTPAR
jgi:hypothetical protein